MKKYINPSIKTVEIEANAILADSGVGVNVDATITGSQRSRERDGLFDWTDDNEE